MSNITVNKRKRTEVGSCNACQERDLEYVYEVSLKTLTFRLCEDCKKELANWLKEEKKGIHGSAISELWFNWDGKK